MVDGDELRDAEPVGREHRLGEKVSGCKVAEEPDLRVPANSRIEEVSDFRYDKLRHDEGTFVRLQEPETGFMIAVVLVHIRVERPGIDDESYRRASRRMISSILRAVSERPLLPAFAAIRRRRPLPPR